MQIRRGPVACYVDGIPAYLEVFDMKRLGDVADKLQEKLLERWKSREKEKLLTWSKNAIDHK